MLDPDYSGLFDALHGVLKMNNQDIREYSDVELLFDFLLRDKGTEHCSVGEGRIFLEINQIFPVSHSGRPWEEALDFKEGKSFVSGAWENWPRNHGIESPVVSLFNSFIEV